MNRGGGERSRKRQSGSAGQKNKDGGSAGVEFDMKKARYDIIKFAMTGLSGTAKHDAETALAISLGAKAPKSAYVNYKDLQVTRKKEKEEQEVRRRNFSKPKTNKLDRKDNKSGSGTGGKKKPVKHSLETTGIYKVKFPPGSSAAGSSKGKSKSHQSRRKGRH